MNVRIQRRLLTLTISLIIILSGSGMVFAAQGETQHHFIPNEQQMGITPGDKTLDYRVYEPDHYTWDLGYDLVEWKGWTPKFHNPLPVILNGIGSGVFIANAYIVRFSIFLMQLGFHTDLVNQQISIIVPIMNGLRIGLFNKFLPFLLVFFVAWMVKVGYWNSQTTRLTTGTMGAILVLAGGFWFMSHTGESIASVSKTMDQLTQVTMGSLAAPYQAMTGEKVKKGGLLSAADQQLLTTSNRVWKLFVDRPWVIGEFNREDASDVLVTKEEAMEIQKQAKEAEIQLPVQEGDPWSIWLRQYASSMPQRDILRTVIASPKVNHGSHQDVPDLFWGGAAGDRCFIAFLSLLATLTLLLFVGTISLILVLAQEMALAVVMLAPLVFLLGIFPERGFSLTRRWIGWLIGVLGTKVIYGFYMGFTLLVVDIVAQGSGILMIQQILVGLLFFCAFLFRKRVLHHLLSLLQAPSPNEIYQTTKTEVVEHWNDTKESWGQTKDKVKRWLPKRKKSDGGESE